MTILHESPAGAPVKVISLTRSAERRTQFAEINAHVDFEFFDAVEGAPVMSRLDSFPELFEPGLHYNAGAIGCAISHLTLWQEAAETDRIMTICEDDAILRHDFQEQAARVIAGLPADWDIVVWAWNFDSILSLNLMPEVSSTVMVFNQAAMRDAIGDFQVMRDAPSPLRLDKCFGTPAYSISPAGARKFMRDCFPLRNFQLHFPVLNRMLPNNGIDIAMNRIYSATNSYCALPPLAVTKNEHSSSLIHEGR